MLTSTISASPHDHSGLEAPQREAAREVARKVVRRHEEEEVRTADDGQSAGGQEGADGGRGTTQVAPGIKVSRYL